MYDNYLWVKEECCGAKIHPETAKKEIEEKGETGAKKGSKISKNLNKVEPIENIEIPIGSRKRRQVQSMLPSSYRAKKAGKVEIDISKMAKGGISKQGFQGILSPRKPKQGQRRGSRFTSFVRSPLKRRTGQPQARIEKKFKKNSLKPNLSHIELSEGEEEKKVGSEKRSFIRNPKSRKTEQLINDDDLFFDIL